MAFSTRAGDTEFWYKPEWMDDDTTIHDQGGAVFLSTLLSLCTTIIVPT